MNMAATARDVGERVAWASQLACILEVSAFKPGNVTPLYDFSDTRFTDFITSALAVGPVMGRATHLHPGELIWQAVEATHAATDQNTNLGIILLFTPLARAYALWLPESALLLETAVGQVLEHLTITDAAQAYAAIRLARPAGLGQVSDHDVAGEPETTLLAAMASAADRDSIAREYASGFSLTFGLGYPGLMQGLSDFGDLRQAVVHTFLRLLAAVPDTLVARKLGAPEALQASTMAGEVLAAGGLQTAEGRRHLARLDGWLRDPDHRRNPGTTADLTAAALFTALLLHGPPLLRRPAGSSARG